MTEIREILPSSGIWTIEDLAKYLNINATILQQKLTDNGIKVLDLDRTYGHKLIRLEDLKKL